MNFAAARTWAYLQLRNRSDSPQLDAEILLCHVLGIERVKLYAQPEKPVAPQQLVKLEHLIAQRMEGYPIAYQLHSKEFWSMTLTVSPQVLIPRAETELLVEQALARIPANKPWRVLELGTGSGAIALALAHERPALSITATDVSAPALAIAKHNAQAHNITSVEFIQSDWFAQLDDGPYDLIVSNPPYIAADDPHLASAVGQHEPTLALIASNQGMAAITTIVSGACDHLRHHGHLLLEHGWQQRHAVSAVMQDSGFVQIENYTDLANHPRVTTGVRDHG